MNKQFECNVILDLLPLYLDGRTCDDTNDVVQEHLKECKECRKVYEEMAGELDFDLHQKVRSERRTIRYKKKSVGRRILWGYIILLLCIMAFCVLDVVLFL